MTLSLTTQRPMSVASLLVFIIGKYSESPFKFVASLRLRRLPRHTLAPRRPGRTEPLGTPVDASL